MLRFIAAVLALAVVANATIYFKDTFDSGASHWTKSKSKSDFGDLKVTSGKWKSDPGLQTSQDARFYGYSAKLDKHFDNEGKTLVFSFSVTHEQNIDCGGGYLKLMPTVDGESFNGDSKYYIMFGPDICGYTKKIHFIINYDGKNVLWKKEPRAESDEKTHFYTLVLNSDNTYEVLVDNEKKESGKLEDDWELLKAKVIDDPSDKKPSDWVDEAEIVDPEDKKPEDWDHEPATIQDPEATKPDDWDEEEDGTWEAPTIPNPKHKGEWKAKRIANPAYKGVWKPKQIPNPEYKDDDKLYHFSDIAHVGLDLWQVKSGSIFDNVLVSDDAADAVALYKDYKKHLDAETAAKNAEDEKNKTEEKKDDDDDDDGEDDEEDGKDEL